MELAMFTRHAIEDSNNIPIPHYAQRRTEPVRGCVGGLMLI
jgi:hypothetical protein